MRGRANEPMGLPFDVELLRLGVGSLFALVMFLASRVLRNFDHRLDVLENESKSQAIAVAKLQAKCYGD